VTVNRATLPLIVDTGADITLLTESAARRAGVRLGPDHPTIVVGGVGGRRAVQLAHVDIEVDGHRETDVLVAVMKDLDLGRRGVGLLGMTFLERFRVSVGRSLDLVPIDADDPVRKGGHGASWWRLRFRQTDARMRAYRSMAASARDVDRQIEAAFGQSADGESYAKAVARLQAFFEAEKRKLRNHAARHAVPMEWRR
jgi:hypothetical protein